MAAAIAGLRIDSGRLWRRLMTMAEIGGTAGGGCNRQALTDEDRAGRDRFVRWATDAGCSVTVDEVGNVFARRAGTDPAAAPVLAGSHLDTQPSGGRFDGVYGVIAALEAVTTLAQSGIETRRSIEVAVWTNEEGCRFAPAMLGSGVVAGVFTAEFACSRVDRHGRRFGDELVRIGYRGSVPAQPRPLAACFEAHIEQGPILEHAGDTIGIVTGIQGLRWFDLVVDGESCHAGPTPMEMRRDPWPGVVSLVQSAYAIVARRRPEARVTFGEARVEPGSRNTVPARIVLSIDLRHPASDELDRMVAELQSQVAAASSDGITARLEPVWQMPATSFDAGLVDLVERTAAALGYRHRRMVSGAGHDSLHTARFAPTAMIFVPCARGLSHNEAESASPADLAAGANVLLNAMLEVANG